MYKPYENSLWKTLVEKPVENVENPLFSTGISALWPRGSAVHRLLHKQKTGKSAVDYVAKGAWEISKKNCQKRVTSGKIAKEIRALFPETGKIFVKKHQNRRRMIFPPQEILWLEKIQEEVYAR